MRRKSMKSRADGRRFDQLREVKLVRGYLRHAEGSVLIEVGDTKVVCACSVEDKVPLFLKGTGRGWVTAEYGMLPRSTAVRTPRDLGRGRAAGRAYEIQRLIGRSLRAVTALGLLGERTVWVDCDVLQADGGTRTAAVTGSFVALVEAMRWMKEQKFIETMPIFDFLAATSVGIVEGSPILDLSFAEDARARVDMNVVMTRGGKFVEIQGTGEGEPFSRAEMDELLALAQGGIRQLIAIQEASLGDLAVEVGDCLGQEARVAGDRKQEEGQGG